MPTRDPIESLYGWGISIIAAAMAVGNILLGAEVFFEPERYGGPSFRYITNGDSSRAEIWGVAFVLFGVAALYGQWTHQRVPTRVAHLASATACLVWGMSFLLASWGPQNATVARSGVIAYAVMIASVHGIVAVVSPYRPRR